MRLPRFKWLLVSLLAGVLMHSGCSNASDMRNDLSAPANAVVQDQADSGSADSMVEDDPIDDEDPGGPASAIPDEMAADDPIDDGDVGGPPLDPQ